MTDSECQEKVKYQIEEKNKHAFLKIKAEFI